MAGGTVLVCEHSRNSDPRFGHQCVKCGSTQPADEVMDRDPQFELDVLRNAADAVCLPHLADSLHAFANKRVEPGPIRIPADRDLVQEWLEEVADGVGNYGPWQLQRMMIEGVEDDHRAAYLQEALRHGLLMYAALRKAHAES